MLVEIFLIPLLFVVFSGWGAYSGFLLKLRCESPVFTVIVGMLLFGIAATLAAFFSPLNAVVEWILVGIGISAYFFPKTRRLVVLPKLSVFRSVWFWIIATAILLGGALYPSWYDHYGYYLPTLRWLDTYGLLIGTANIDWIIGQMSMMHIIQAAIDESVEPYCRLGLFCTIVFLYYVFERKTWLLLLFIPYFFLMFQSPSSDIPLILFSLIIVNETIFFYRKGDFKLHLVIAAFLFSVKPIAFWTVLFVFIMAYLNDREAVKKTATYIFPALVFILFIIKNLIVTSCLVYPFTITKINTPWLPDAQVLHLSEINARKISYDFYYTPDEIAAFTPLERMTKFLTLPDPQTVVNYLIFAVSILFIVLAFRKRNVAMMVFCPFLIIKLFVTYFYSAQYRLMLDIVFPAVFILLMLSKNKLATKKMAVLGISTFLCVFAWFFISFPTISIKIYPRPRMINMYSGISLPALIRPANMIILEYDETEFGNLKFNLSSKILYNCDTPPPAITSVLLYQYAEMKVFPQWIDSTNIRKGLYIKNLSDDEAEKLKCIFEKYQ
jgi:hypothetical protein